VAELICVNRRRFCSLDRSVSVQLQKERCP